MLGVAAAAMERVTGRATLWATAQYLSYAVGTAPLDLSVTVEVHGHNTTQARCIVARDGQEILTAHSALGARDIDLTMTWSSPPVVPAPEECPRFTVFQRGMGDMGDLVEMRLAKGRHLSESLTSQQPGDGSFAFWVRAWAEDERPISIADLAFIGDMMPLTFSDALAGPYRCNSLDNTIRVAQLVTTGWILLSCQAQHASKGFGFGQAEMWSQNGTLLGAVSQTVIIRRRSRASEA